MARQKSKLPRADGRYEIKRTIKGLYDDNGKPLRKSFYSYESIADCERQYQDYLVEFRANSLLGLDGNIRKDVTVAEWAREWLKVYKKGKIKESSYIAGCQFPVERFIIPTLGMFNVAAIKPFQIEQWLTEWKEKYSDTTVRKIKLCLNAIFETAVDNGVCLKNPCKNIKLRFDKKKSAKRTYSQEMRDAIIAFSVSHKDGLYIRLLLENGLRLSEMCGLQWGDFDLGNRTVTIRRAATDVNGGVEVGKPKNATSAREIPITTELAEMVKILRNGDGFIITTSRTKDVLPPRQFRDYRYKHFFEDFSETLSEDQRTSFEVLSPHELRHTCGTLLYAKSKDIYAVSKFLGHSSVDITASVYVHDTPSLLRENLGF